MENEPDSTESEPREGDDELRGLLDSEKRRSEDYLTRLKYMQADFENYRKRAEKELREVEDASLRGLVVNLLSTLDELELAVKNAKKGEHGEDLMDGLRMVKKNLTASLQAAGLSRIECVGRPFDPSLHEAVEKVQGKRQGDDMVTEEVRPGYAFRGKVLRPTMVKVELALKTPGEQEAAAGE